ncbi:MAG: hypothetical protein M1378_00790 [Bacteroidetes bacterium]|nr:hypothetical protein [Bacteroidota bacterium]
MLKKIVFVVVGFILVGALFVTGISEMAKGESSTGTAIFWAGFAIAYFGTLFGLPHVVNVEDVKALMQEEFRTCYAGSRTLSFDEVFDRLARRVLEYLLYPFISKRKRG